MKIFLLEKRGCFEMNERYKRFITLIVLIVFLITSAFSSVTENTTINNDCGLFSILETVFTNNKPFSISKEQILDLIVNYFSDVVDQIATLPDNVKKASTTPLI